MERREAVRNIAFLMGGALSATTIGVFLDSCNTPSAKNGSGLFSADQDQMITEIADIIIPTTKTPGAKAAGVGPWISMMVRDCYPKEAQDVFVKGLEDLEARSKKEYNNSFLKISVKEREQLLGKVRDETVAAQKADGEKNAAAEKAKSKALTNTVKAAKYGPQGPSYFFAIARDLTMLGYFTSEIGATQALQYVDVPGRYDGCIDLKPGQKVYA
ncbi:twin-arginine translocation pathway signal protein [Pedobacter lusitanus]|uniref:Twin-arginine translocation pathway signal protein n=1 Tax=Pedobacter lusitanus TaxID=1503925 RepID=A0A0D0GEW2_9SPHI|nr:gluconate 2-dehydrogenase subunit 3 family protein [Pedobacter lusitanus]KIO74730.1 twin-arginine translocation pathway signal protein [Pedobacter lusitanus]